MITFLRPLSEQPPDNLECESQAWTDANGKVSGLRFVLRVPKRQPAEDPEK